MLNLRSKLFILNPLFKLLIKLAVIHALYTMLLHRLIYWYVVRETKLNFIWNKIQMERLGLRLADIHFGILKNRVGI